MKRRVLALVALTTALAGVTSPAVGGRQDVAIVRVGNLVLRANGAVIPQVLPQRRYAPVHFQGYGSIRAVNGAVPPAATRAVVNFDRDGRLNVRGLPVCPPSRVRLLPPLPARHACRRAVVGTGRITATVALPGIGPVKVSSPLTIFNGPKQGKNATAILHAWTKFPVPEIYAPVVTLERRRQGVRASVDIPEIAGGFGSITRIQVNIGRRWRFRGGKLSYAAARCSRGVLTTNGRFDFDDGTVIYGSLFTPCRVRSARRVR